MRRYVAFLRGVSPMNAKMPDLKRCFEAAGFTDVKTVLSSGNVVFSARAAAAATLETKAETAMAKELGRTFRTIVRPASALRELLEADPYAASRVPAKAKRVVTFLREPPQGQAIAPARNRWRAHRRDERLRSLHRLCSKPARRRIHDADREDLRHRCDDSDLGDDQEVRRCGG